VIPVRPVVAERRGRSVRSRFGSAAILRIRAGNGTIRRWSRAEVLAGTVCVAERVAFRVEDPCPSVAGALARPHGLAGIERVQHCGRSPCVLVHQDLTLCVHHLLLRGKFTDALRARATSRQMHAVAETEDGEQHGHDRPDQHPDDSCEPPPWRRRCQRRNGGAGGLRAARLAGLSRELGEKIVEVGRAIVEVVVVRHGAYVRVDGSAWKWGSGTSDNEWSRPRSGRATGGLEGHGQRVSQHLRCTRTSRQPRERSHGCRLVRC